MRSSKSRTRSKSNRNRPSGGNVVNRVFDSSGPEGKVRGTPQQIIDKYNQLARDAQLANDRVATENFQQHAEHYLRMLSEAQREQDQRREEQERQNRDRQAERDRDRDRDRSNNNRQDRDPSQQNQPQQHQPQGGQQPQSGPQEQPAPEADAVTDAAPAPVREDPVQQGSFALDVVDAGDASDSDSNLVETPETAPKPARKPRKKPAPKPKAEGAEASADVVPMPAKEKPARTRAPRKPAADVDSNSSPDAAE
ncbi:DUF4167 domain-containing protein [Chachezhania sediminis]|uniref:DUF4167 domain-containing protein n=1 Tax=Chachezhania sediminis TaxID=2599291 RepID=UPI00131C2E77|nr:DUF4167 domain-containing protein [Chachezhania sediminis]